MKPDRFHKGHKILEDFNPVETFIKVDSKDFQRPCTISLEVVGKILQISIDDEIFERNVTSVEFEGQDKDPTLPPNTFKISEKTHIAVDENYLYVWVPQLEKWKRMLLSDWK